MFRAFNDFVSGYEYIFLNFFSVYFVCHFRKNKIWATKLTVGLLVNRVMKGGNNRLGSFWLSGIKVFERVKHKTMNNFCPVMIKNIQPQ